MSYQQDHQHPDSLKKTRPVQRPNVEIQEIEDQEDGDDQGQGIWNRFRIAPFENMTLARELKRHHITGIAFSAVVGIGLFQTSGEIVAIGGSVGALIAFLFASLIIFSVMRSLAEMLSVRPVNGALMDFPSVFVDEALGFTVGVVYWLANGFSMVTLTGAAAVFTQYWESSLSVSSATFILLVIIALMNICGVKLYGNLEWVFKWLKIILLLAVIALSIAIKAGAGPKDITTNYALVEGYSSIGFNIVKRDATSIMTEPMIRGTGGKILAVWTCLTSAMFQFMGGEMVLVTAGEARAPRRDLPTAARYMYLLPIGFYLIGIFVVGLCLDYNDPALYHPHIPSGLPSARRSPFVVAAVNAGISVMPGFLNACFLFSALTAANSALYASSRTLFFMASKSEMKIVRETLGRTNHGHTPVAAILLSVIPGSLAFLSVKYKEAVFAEPLHVLGRLYTGPVLCVYASECLAFLCFMRGMRYYPYSIDRNDENYSARHYRAHWQPVWAGLGLVLCLLLIIFSGWNAVYDLCVQSGSIPIRESIIDLIFIYIGPVVFICIYLGYKLRYQTQIRDPRRDFRNLWFVRDVLEDLDIGRAPNRGRFREFVSWIR